MELEVTGDKKKKIKVAEDIFECIFNEPLVHQVVTAYMSAGRAGTQAQKTRAAVRGGGAKPWRQKGTGRARAGTIRSPLWRKGGVIFAAQPRSYEQKVNKKMYRGALRSILSELIRTDRFMVLDSFEMTSPKTKDLLKKLDALAAGHDVLIVTAALDENTYLAARNLPTVNICDVTAVDPVSLVRAEKVLITIAALKQFEEFLK
jgi:large subunit ribosomal protein L4